MAARKTSRSEFAAQVATLFTDSVLKMDPVVLVIDDDEKMRELISDILTAFNFRVLPAESSEDALMTVLSHKVDVVLCDLVLPDALGFDTARALRAHPATADIPVVFITGYPYLRNYSGMDQCDIVTKPFTMQAIVEAVKNALARRVAAASVPT